MPVAAAVVMGAKMTLAQAEQVAAGTVGLVTMDRQERRILAAAVAVGQMDGPVGTVVPA